MMQQPWTVEGTLGASGRLEITPNSTGIQAFTEWENSSAMHQRNIEIVQSAQRILRFEGGYRFNDALFAYFMGSRNYLFEYSDQLNIRNYSFSKYSLEPSISARVNRSWNIKAILKHSRLNDNHMFARNLYQLRIRPLIFPHLHFSNGNIDSNKLYMCQGVYKLGCK